MTSSFTVVAPLLAAFLLGACGGGTSSSNPVGVADSGLGETVACNNNPVPFSAGMHASSQTTGVTVAIDSDHPVPTLGDESHFKLTLTDKSGAPVPTGTVVSMKCVMMMGGAGKSHGCPANITVKDLGNGAYDAYPVIFNMPGAWGITFTIGATDTVTFPLCIE